MNDKERLLSISCIDGRYKKYLEELVNYFSEYALFRYRLKIEIKYLIEFLQILKTDNDWKIETDVLNKILNEFDINECIKIKKKEQITNHDVKAIEYYLQDIFKEKNLDHIITYIHFGLTSQDINNTANPLMIKDYMNWHYLCTLESILDDLLLKSDKWKNKIMISKTHGQPAVPTSFGKELKVFHYRLNRQYDTLKNMSFYGKFGGATGNFNAHKCAFPDINWKEFAFKFLDSLGLKHNKYTTQIDNYENYSTLFDNLKRVNSILIDLCQDIWLYISNEYLILKKKEGEIGSSTMPHKVNPINFENAEGNLIFANSMLECLSRKLPISRLQRDLTDSTLLRNIGSIFGHIMIAMVNIKKGLEKIKLNEHKLKEDCVKNIIVTIEGVQTILRKHNIENAYEICKDFSSSQNVNINILDIEFFIDDLQIKQEIKDEIKKFIDPENYIGYASDL